MLLPVIVTHRALAGSTPASSDCTSRSAGYASNSSRPTSCHFLRPTLPSLRNGTSTSSEGRGVLSSQTSIGPSIVASGSRTTAGIGAVPLGHPAAQLVCAQTEVFGDWVDLFILGRGDLAVKDSGNGGLPDASAATELRWGYSMLRQKGGQDVLDRTFCMDAMLPMPCA